METAIVNAFDTIGARVKLQMTRPARGPWNRRRENRFFGDAVRVDIQHDQHGAYSLAGHAEPGLPRLRG